MGHSTINQLIGIGGVVWILGCMGWFWLGVRKTNRDIREDRKRRGKKIIDV